MTHGGARAGAGRPKGRTTKATEAAIEAAAATGLLPHEFLLAVARGETIDGHTPTFAERMDAAKAAAPYYAPRLQSADVAVRRVSSFSDLSDAELAALAGTALPH